MKALSLWQPWATLIADGEKKWETRSRTIKYRGLLAIHAAKNRDAMIVYRRPFPIRERLLANGNSESQDLPLGCVVAVCTVIDCITTGLWLRHYCKTPTKPEDDREFCFGNYEPNRWAYKLEDVRKLREPYPMAGRQSLWTLTEAQESDILSLL